ncbi:MAG: glutamine--fructose-6-phosphate transaminase (isomerizing) [Candidatus Marinimicrobia bacterium]|nr:glutamine--fructose-6-phosphate transaminase (isomerizing) [Candidatus Neomarinimicrobiota bacterium]
MCGIIGYIGIDHVEKYLIEGLKKMEYRGYDSAGICVKDDYLDVVKKSGGIANLEKALLDRKFSGNTGIGHTRWATHGAPNDLNAHPHLSFQSDIAVVHNGIIENYATLKRFLLEKGVRFSSQTDSEVLAHLIESFYTGNLEEAVSKALQNVDGTYGLAVLHRHENKIIAARKGSPLILGIGDSMMMVASDAVPLLDHTNKVIYLEDNDLAVLTRNQYDIMKINGRKVRREIEEIQWNISQIEKRGFKHFMLKEIYEQPEAMRNTLRGRIKGDTIKLSVNFDAEKLNRIVITACGTSWHSALIGKYFMEEILQLPVEVDYASEFRYRTTALAKDDLFIVISQSGETADTLAALRKAKSLGCQTLGIVNVVGSSIARETESGIYLHAGPEIGVASTKAFLCQITSLMLLALAIQQAKGKTISSRMINELEILPEKIQEIIANEKQLRVLAYRLQNATNFLYLGRGVNFPVALEGALKLKEISTIHAEGYPAAEMKHGPIALIDASMPVVFIAPEGKILTKILSNMEEVKARQGQILTITDSQNPKLQELSDHIFMVPKTLEIFTPFLTTVPLQILAYYIADMKGINVDKPRNLAKSVTVE